MSNYRTNTTTTYNTLVQEATTGNYNSRAEYHPGKGMWYWGSDFLGQLVTTLPNKTITVEVRGGERITGLPEVVIPAMVESYKANR